MKREFLTLLGRCGVFASFRYLNKNKLLIVTYHRFSKQDDGRSTSAQVFVDQLDYVKRSYSVVPLSQVESCLNEDRALPEKSAVLTIDDGFHDAYDIAFPLLRERGLSATLFVITGFVDQKTWLWTDKLRYITSRLKSDHIRFGFDRHDFTFDLDGDHSRSRAADKINSVLKELPEEQKNAAIRQISENVDVDLPHHPPPEYAPVTWDQIREMNQAGIDIGSHTVTHPILPNVDDLQLRDELVNSKTRLEAVLGHPVTQFCYPNGTYDARVAQAVRDSGYKVAVTTEPRLNDQRTNPHALARVSTELDLDHFEQTTSGFEQFKNELRPRRAN